MGTAEKMDARTQHGRLEDIRKDLQKALAAADDAWDKVQESTPESPTAFVSGEAARVEAAERLEAEMKRAGALLLDAFRAGGDVDITERSTPEISADNVVDISASQECEEGPSTAPSENAQPGKSEQREGVDDEEVLETLRDGLEERFDGVTVPAEYRRNAELLPDFREKIDSAAAELESPEDIRRELDALDDLLSLDSRQALAKLNDETHRVILTLMAAKTARLRALPQRKRQEHFVDLRLKGLMNRLFGHLDEHNPGYVRGLKGHEGPYKQDWTEDIAHWTARLDELVDDYFGGEDAEESEPFNADRALTRIQQGLEGDKSLEEISKMVLDAMDKGLKADDKRLVNLLMPHAERFDRPGLEKIYNVLRRAKEAKEGGQETEGRFESLEEAVSVAERDFDTLNLFREARKASRCACKNPEKVYDALEAIAYVGELYIESVRHDESMGNTMGGILREHGVEYAHGETDVTRGKYGEQRKFNGREIHRHVTLGQGSSSDCFQIYFEPCPERGVVDVGYIGPHLDYAGSTS